MKPSLLNVCVVVIILSISCAINEVEAKKKKVNYCNVNSFFDCLVFSLARFTHQTNGTGIPRNDEEFEELCSMFHDVQPYCVKKYTERCGSPIAQELYFNFWSKRLQESYKKFCDPTKPERRAFVKHAPCLIDKVKLAPAYRQDCVRKFQGNHEYLHEKAKEWKTQKHGIVKGIRGTCCIYNSWENCIVRHLRQQCGQDAVDTLSAGDVFPFLIQHSAIMVPVTLCPKSRYDPDNPNSECIKEEFMAPLEYVPKGIKSQSFPSYFFSLSCPNVGYGVEESRDT